MVGVYPGVAWKARRWDQQADVVISDEAVLHVERLPGVAASAMRASTQTRFRAQAESGVGRPLAARLPPACRVRGRARAFHVCQRLVGRPRHRRRRRQPAQALNSSTRSKSMSLRRWRVGARPPFAARRTPRRGRRASHPRPRSFRLAARRASKRLGLGQSQPCQRRPG